MKNSYSGYEGEHYYINLEETLLENIYFMLPEFDLNEHPNKRYNLLTGEWVMVCPKSNIHSWQVKKEEIPVSMPQEYKSSGYISAKNKQVEGMVNPDNKVPYVFDNDQSALIPDIPKRTVNIEGLLKDNRERGNCRKICFSPKHNARLPDLTLVEIYTIIYLMQNEYLKQAENKHIRYIQIFENKGEMMDSYKQHHQGQIWSSEDIPVEIGNETKKQLEYHCEFDKSLLGFYLDMEIHQEDRIVYQNAHFVVLVPYWALWPFETMIISRSHVQDITQFEVAETWAMADAIKQITEAYDLLFETSSSHYSSGMHQKPINDGSHKEWHWHMHFYPPLLRSASSRKFMVGYELLANPVREITPESAALKLRILCNL